MFPRRLYKSSEIPHKALESHPRREVPSPEGMRLISIGEEVINLSRICNLFLLNGIDIVIGYGVQQLDSEFRSCINVVDQFIVVFVPHTGVGIMEIFPNGVEEIGCAVVHSLSFEVLHQLIGLIYQVVVLERRVVFDGFVSAVGIEAELRRRGVVIVVDMREDVVVLASAVLDRSPYHLHGFTIQSQHLILVVNPGEEEGLEPHLTEESGRGGVMSKGIDVPCNTGNVVEGFLQPSQTYSHLVNKILVVHVGFIRHAPTSIDKLQLPVCYDGLHLLLLPVRGQVPPTIEEGDLHYGKFVLRMFVQLTDNCIDCVLNSCKLCAHVSSVEVVVNCFEPSNIVMRMGDEMDSEIRSIFRDRFAMMQFHHVFVLEAKCCEGYLHHHCANQQGHSVSFGHNSFKIIQILKVQSIINSIQSKPRFSISQATEDQGGSCPAQCIPHPLQFSPFPVYARNGQTDHCYVYCDKQYNRMKAHSPVVGRPSAKSVNLYPRKPSKQSCKSFACNIQQFQFDLPNSSIPITVRAIQTTPSPEEPPHQKSDLHFEDCRKELIKQKIKFRVKQEMWNLLKKTCQRPILPCATPFEYKRQSNPQTPTVFVKGASFVRLSQENITFRKASEFSQAKNLSKSYYKGAKQNQSEIGLGKKHKRVWSSFVKMREKDRLELQRTEHRASASSANIEKLDSYKIEPWKGFEDSQNLLEER